MVVLRLRLAGEGDEDQLTSELVLKIAPILDTIIS